MGQISESRLQRVRGLIERAPDAAVHDLVLALSAGVGHDERLARVQRLVEAEAADRRARNLALEPVAPLCAAAGPMTALSFPARTLSLIWSALKSACGDDV